MMIPNKSPSAEPMPAAITIPPVVAAPAIADEYSLMHADYNLLPLGVRSLDHYVAHEDEGERFHVR